MEAPLKSRCPIPRELYMQRPRRDPSPTALRSPLSPWERALLILSLSLGERGDRKAVGEGSLLSPSVFDGTL